MSELDSTKEGPKDNQVFKNVEDAINEVRTGKVVGVYEDTFSGQSHAKYIVFYDEERFKKFEEVIELTKNLPSEGRQKIFDDLHSLAGSDVESSSLYWIYRNGEWASPPESLLKDAALTKLDEEDQEWFETQREHFAGIEDADPLGEQSRRMQEAEERG